MNIEQVSDLSSALSIKFASRDVSVNGEEVDLQEYEAAMIVVISGIIGARGADITLEESDTSGSGYTAVAAGDLKGSGPSIVNANDDTTWTFGYTGTKRYIRVVGTATGSTGAGIYGAAVVRGHARAAPVTNN